MWTSIIRSFPKGTIAPKRSIARLLIRTVVDQLAPTSSNHSERANLEDVVRHIRGNDIASRWILTWTARSLPALGFIGTVHGIALALMGADALVRATTTESQAAAVNLVAGNLGIAFTTTFIALVMGLVTSWLSDHQAYKERRFLSEMEREVGYLIQPIGFDRKAAMPTYMGSSKKRRSPPTDTDVA